MDIDRKQIIEYLAVRGRHDTITTAARVLPERFDPEKEAVTLAHLGINRWEIEALTPKKVSRKKQPEPETKPKPADPTQTTAKQTDK